MLDSNVLFSALAFPESNVEEIVDHIKRNHSIVLSEYIIDRGTNDREYIQVFVYGCGY